MKINFTMTSTTRSGGARAIYEIANGLSRRGHDITITALQGDHSWFPLKVEVIYVKKPLPLKILRPIIMLKSNQPGLYSHMCEILRIMKMGIEPDFVKPLTEAIPECDINVATWFHTSFAVYRSGKGIQFYLFMDFEDMVRPLGRYYVQMFKESLYLPFNILTISQWLGDWISDNYHKKSTICGLGIDHDVFYPRNMIENLPGKKVMGLLRGWDHKGDDDLIKALNIVKDEITDLNFLAVGSKEILQKLKTEEFNFNYQFFEEPNDDLLAKIYSSADIFAFPSHIEGFGLPPLEAMACGCPVVTTDCLGTRDYVKDGVNAIEVSVQDPEEMASSLIKLLNDKTLREKLSENGLKTAKMFTWDRVIDKFEKEFSKCKNRS
jgi:glycosyltransferase involved in cell wall biosynthesis